MNRDETKGLPGWPGMIREGRDLPASSVALQTCSGTQPGMTGVIPGLCRDGPGDPGR